MNVKQKLNKNGSTLVLYALIGIVLALMTAPIFLNFINALTGMNQRESDDYFTIQSNIVKLKDQESKEFALTLDKNSKMIFINKEEDFKVGDKIFTRPIKCEDSACVCLCNDYKVKEAISCSSIKCTKVDIIKFLGTDSNVNGVLLSADDGVIFATERNKNTISIFKQNEARITPLDIGKMDSTSNNIGNIKPEDNQIAPEVAGGSMQLP